MLRIRLGKDGGGGDDRQHESSGTYSDHPVPGPGCEQFAVWAETYAPNVVARSFMDQVTVQR